jgi:WD40 repeat protein
MPIQMHCPNPSCGKLARLPDAAQGRVMRCPACHQTFRVPNETCVDEARATQGPAVVRARGDIPERIGRFEVRERLGAGAFGAVYRAWDPELQRELALKVPHPAVLADPRLVERFLREGKAAAGLNHPHIVPVYDAGQDGDHFYLAAAFVPGSSLQGTAGGKPLEPRRAAGVVRQLAEALAYAHGQGVVHRDVKPANVLLDEHGDPLLADFGLAYRQEAAENLTHDGAILGTPAYMAPEVAEGQTGEPVPASDQYALGVVLYELLTGQTPFEGPPALVLYNVVHTEPDSPRKVNPVVPEDLERVCLKALAKRPSDRYPDCQALAEDLRGWLDGEPVQARPLSPVERVVRWCRREPRLVAAGMLTVVCLLVVAFLAIIRTRELAGVNDRAGELKAQAEEQVALANHNAAEGTRLAEEAERRKAEAEQTRKDADEQNQAAEQKRRLQEQKTVEAIRLEQQARNEERRGRRVLYKSDLVMARRASDRGDNAQARLLLEKYIPSSLADELRDGDWDSLWAMVAVSSPALTHGGAVLSVTFHPDGLRLATASEDGTARLWKARSRQEIRRFTGHTGPVLSVCFRPDGQQLASGGDDTTIKLWDVRTGREIRTLKGHANSVTSVCFGPDGKRLASASRDKTIKVWDTQTGQKQRSFGGHTDTITSVCFSPDGKRIASASEDQTVKVWDAQTGQEVLTLKGHTSVVSSVCFSPDGKRLASASKDQTVKVWEAKTGQQQLTLTAHKGPVDRVCFSPDGKLLASASYDQTVKVWEADTGEEAFSLKGHTGRVTSVCFSPDAQRLASGSDDQTVKVWDVHGGERTLSLKGHTGPIYSVCFSPDGKRLASSSYDQRVKVWDAQSGQEQLTLKGHVLGVRSVCFSPDGHRLASASMDQTVKVWDAQTGQQTLSLQGHTSSVTSVAFSPDGKRIVSGSNDQTVKVWDAQTGQEALSLKGHTNWVTSVAFSPDGKRIVSGSNDQTVKVWGWLPF